MLQKYFRLICTLFLLQKMLATEGQQPYANYPKQADLRFTRRNQNNMQQLPYNPPPQEGSHQWRGELHHSPQNLNSNNYQSSYQAGQHNQNAQIGNSVADHNRHNNGSPHHNQDKCRIWVPADVVDKYSESRKIQTDQQQKLMLIETCCNGYTPVKWRGSFYCQPICENCRNGRCVAPGECRCHEGFVKSDNDECVFICPLGCLNGQCYLDGTCKCDPGYKLDKTRQYCQPICSSGCGLNIRHNCTEPEVCSCAKGYQLTDEGCQPICNPDCGIGGICREANLCECEHGYVLKDGVCQADCYQKCENGICYARNRCICNPGYTYHEKSTFCVLA